MRLYARLTILLVLLLFIVSAARARRETISTGDAADHFVDPPTGGLLMVTAWRARANACAVCLGAEGQAAVLLR